MLEYVLVSERVEVDYYGNKNSYWSGLEKGKRVVRRNKSDNLEEVRSKVRYLIGEGMLREFIGFGWRCVWEDGRYWWSKVRDLEEYVDDLDVDYCS